MPLFSEHIANMYYGSSSPYTGSPYSYSSSVSPIGSSYSASYLNPGGNYSKHSSLSGYSRAPLSSRWITSSGRNYSPMLSTITERGSANPVRINSPRRLAISTRNYGTSNYTPRPVNINTADIDVSRDKYRHKVEPSAPYQPPTPSKGRNESEEIINDPFMPRVDGKEVFDSDSPTEGKRGTIKRGRTVVRLYTIKRKERDSPRKPAEEQQCLSDTSNLEIVANVDDDSKANEKEFMKWREKLSDDLAYKEKKEKKSLGAKLVEKFILKDDNDTHSESPNKSQETEIKNTDNLSTASPASNSLVSKCLDRRCSMELLAEQANLFDSLIRSENLSTATLDLSKVGIVENKNNLETFESLKRHKSANLHYPIKTTKSDHSLHDSLKPHKDVRDSRNFCKRRSIKKSSSGSCIRKLDSITEFPKELNNTNLPAIEESRPSIKQENTKPKPKCKLKTKITSSVEVSQPKSPLKFKVENVVVEEKRRPLNKEITYSSEVEEVPTTRATKLDNIIDKQNDITSTVIKVNAEKELPSPEPENCNFWDKIGKRETVYLMKRKQNIDEAKEKHKRALFWFPETEEVASELTFNGMYESSSTTNDSGNKEDNITLNTLLNHEPSHTEDENISDEKSHNALGLKLSKQLASTKDSNKAENSNILPVTQTEMNISIEAAKHIASDLVVDEIHDKNDLASEKICEIDNSQPKCTTIRLRRTKMNIGKSASLEIVNNNKIDVVSLKKTKSEKSKKALKVDNITEVNALQLRELNTRNSTNRSDTHKVPCPVHSCIPQKVKEHGIKLEQKSESEKSINNIELSKLNKAGEGESKHSLTINTCTDNKVIEKYSELSEANETEKQMANTLTDSTENLILHELESNTSTIKHKIESMNPEMTNVKQKLNISHLLYERETKDGITMSKSNVSVEKDSVIVDSPSNINETSNLLVKHSNVLTTTLQKPANLESDSSDSSETTKIETNIVPTMQMLTPQDIPNEENKLQTQEELQSEEMTQGKSKNENETEKEGKIANPEKDNVSVPQVIKVKRPVKEEKATRPLIATPRPLQKKAPQVIHSSDSSDTSSEEESSEEDDASDSSDDSSEFIECQNNPDGRTSTGSNDSGFDSSAPTSPATFSQIRKDCDVNCHRKCEKLTANLCGVNQRLLVEALASRTASKKGGEVSATSSTSPNAQCKNTDILEQELEQSTAYDIFRKTGRFTPPARSIPRFRKYTVEDFQFIKVLGKGSFGKVLLAELRDTEYYYAVKCLKKDVVLEDDDVECTLIERKVLALGTNHPYLCHLFATFQTDSHLFFVMEYLNGGDLMFHIQQSGRFPEARGRFYAAEIVSGLKFLHKRGIVYRDLKLDNILLDYEGHVRIADFGMCKLQIYLDKTADTFCGTPDYMAPEIIKGLKYNQTVDWWSFGVLLYEMLIGQSPFSGCDEDELFWSICNEMPSYPRFLSHEALTILTRLLDKDARTRLGGTECMHGDVRDQEFFHSIHWDRLERRELETPFRPRVRHPMDTQYFDRAFTGERPRLTAVEPQVLRSMDQEPFRGFSYTNPNTTDL